MSVSINTGPTLGNVPIGGIVAWHKNINAPNPALTLPYGWIECNGAVITYGPLIGLTAPDLNANATTGRFLWGAATSGTSGDTSTHDHTYSGTTGFDSASTGSGPLAGASANRHTHAYSGTTSSVKVLPPYFTIVWVMRIA